MVMKNTPFSLVYLSNSDPFICPYLLMWRPCWMLSVWSCLWPDWRFICWVQKCSNSRWPLMYSTAQLDTPHSIHFLYSQHYLHCRFSKLRMNAWNCVLNKKYEINQYVLYNRFLKIATLCFFWQRCNPWCSLSELHEVVTWRDFASQVCLFRVT